MPKVPLYPTVDGDLDLGVIHPGESKVVQFQIKVAPFAVDENGMGTDTYCYSNADYSIVIGSGGSDSLFGFVAGGFGSVATDASAIEITGPGAAFSGSWKTAEGASPWVAYSVDSIGTGGTDKTYQVEVYYAPAGIQLEGTYGVRLVAYLQGTDGILMNEGTDLLIDVTWTVSNTPAVLIPGMPQLDQLGKTGVSSLGVM